MKARNLLLGIFVIVFISASAFAAGDKVRNRYAGSKGVGPVTVKVSADKVQTLEQTQDKTQDQTQDKLQDGSCQQDCTGDQAQDQTQDKLQDGSCQQDCTGDQAQDQTQDKLQDGSCQQDCTGDQAQDQTQDKLQDGSCQQDCTGDQAQDQNQDQLQDGSCQQDCTGDQPTDEQAYALVYLLAEETLAHDVYAALAEVYQLNIFANIADSEQSHMDAVENLIYLYGIDMVLTPDDEQFFTDEYEILALGPQNIIEALEVGVLIEEMDIADIEAMLADDTLPASEVQVLTNLLVASEKHLAAFTRVLAVLSAQ